MEADNDYYLKLKTARLYYEKNMTQQQVARQLHLSRPTISKLLKQAQEEGIVQIRVVDIKNKNNLLKLEKRLEQAFGLQEAIVTDFEGESEQKLKEELGEKAARYFENILDDGLKIGVSWGTTLKAVVDHLSGNRRLNQIGVLTLVGGSSHLSSDIHANILCERLASMYNGRGNFLYAPVIVDEEWILEAIRENQETGDVLQRAREVDIALVGIGGDLEYSTLLETGYFTKKDIERLRQYGSIGDICSRFFDVKGRACQLDINRRIVSLELDDLRQIDRVIGVAGGAEKVTSILGALRGGFINVLVTDNLTASRVLQSQDQT
ncbi:MAG: sugar-binding transcriptional regulator [Bacillota bacterium]